MAVKMAALCSIAAIAIHGFFNPGDVTAEYALAVARGTQTNGHTA
jgi:hypothetical protein